VVYYPPRPGRSRPAGFAPGMPSWRTFTDPLRGHAALFVPTPATEVSSASMREEGHGRACIFYLHLPW
jgi:hypothetical protein